MINDPTNIKTTTYNPQENSFIKRPELKICAACGQPLPSDVKPFNNHMNNYIAVTDGAKAMTINSHLDELTIGGVKVYKVDSEAHKKATIKPAAPVTPPIK